ncbi:predicted protein [Plenodomus lingam JN3]|uniref:Predicted protein n=1 Tax=Leptosphaeria maculans (strain JN3 / isolate v23.1.3 / race Av1-4-5-6-7-8) TaxID=985895 RepID=E4ZR16_LEPMJ|nr:predicted protein [Plenodomus lingam JN3]CBX93681.1 predicted protein [Plenodomus lingam JN3]
MYTSAQFKKFKKFKIKLYRVAPADIVKRRFACSIAAQLHQRAPPHSINKSADDDYREKDKLS